MKNKIFWCKACLNMSSRPRIQFDQRGFCNACVWSEKKKNYNWSLRTKELKALLKKYKSKKNNFDCIVPVSGGKDGSYVAYKLKHEYGMRPLAVTSRPPLTKKIGNQNLENFVRSGYDHIHVTGNEDAMRLLNRLGFEHLGFAYFGWYLSIFSTVIRIAIALNIPLIFYGENGELEYGGTFKFTEDKKNKNFLDFNKLKFNFEDIEKVFFNNKYKKIMKIANLSPAESYWFRLPENFKNKKKNLYLTWWNMFEPWDSYRNYLVAKEYCNLEESRTSNSGTFTNFAQTDQQLYELHMYLMYLKFGFGRAIQDVGIEIRRGAMTRDQGINLAKVYDGKYPKDNIEIYLDYFKMSKKEFDQLLDYWVNKKLFYKCKKTKIWKPKFTIGQDFIY